VSDRIVWYGCVWFGASAAPRLAVAAVYQQLPAEPMKFLWGKELKLNTVHVADVARAAWLSAAELPTGSIFNLADETNLGISPPSPHRPRSSPLAHRLCCGCDGGGG
jgi:hypothetical protein